VVNIVNSIGFRRNPKNIGLPSSAVEPNPHPRSVKTKILIRKVYRLTNAVNSLGITKMSKKLKVSRKTVWNAINQDLKAKVKKKRLVHPLKPQHKANRKSNRQETGTVRPRFEESVGNKCYSQRRHPCQKS